METTMEQEMPTESDARLSRAYRIMKPALLVLCGFLIAATGSVLTPYSAKFPGGKTLDHTGGSIPQLAQAFAPFKDRLGLSWDEDFLYIETNGLPDHGMMKGITAWQQQVPILHDYTGTNAFKLPLNPEYVETPEELTLMGPIAIAVNGIPIFHALTQSGKDAYAGGELDEWGGHCGRADDYHYHIAPTHLEPIVGKGNPVAFGLDGYPIYLSDPSKDKPLDECHGYFDDDGNYRYVGELKPPYVMSYFRGKADLESRPRAGGIRPFLRPLRGAKITDFSGSLHEGFHLEYDVYGEKSTIDYRFNGNGGADFVFTNADGSTTEESYEKRPQLGGKGKGKGDKKRPKGEKGKGEGKGDKGGKGEPTAEEQGGRRPWIVNHAEELDTNQDGKVDFESELIAEVNRIFAGLDRNRDGSIDQAELAAKGGRSPMNGFVHQHASELDRDRNGISRDELTREFTKFFRRADLNKDNALTKDELK
ncbi:MAG: YHYH protein [Verrucomicrobiota bacterium]